MSWDLLTSVSGLEAAEDGVADGPGGCTGAEEDIGLDDPGLGITLGLELTGSDIVLNVSVDIVFDFSVTVEGTEPTGVGVAGGVINGTFLMSIIFLTSKTFSAAGLVASLG